MEPAQSICTPESTFVFYAPSDDTRIGKPSNQDGAYGPLFRKRSLRVDHPHPKLPGSSAALGVFYLVFVPGPWANVVGTLLASYPGFCETKFAGPRRRRKRNACLGCPIRS